VTERALEFRLSATDAPLPPMVRGLPLLGNLLDWLRSPHDFYLSSMRRHGPVYRHRMPGRVHYVLVGAQANLTFAKLEQAGALVSEPIFRDFARELGSEKLMIGADGAVHRDLRRAFKGGLSRSTIEGKADEVARIVAERAARLRSRERVDAIEFCRRLICDELGVVLANNTITSAQYRDVALIMRTLLEVTVVKRWPRIMLKRPAYRAAVRRALVLANDLVARHRPAPESADEGNLIHDLVRALDSGLLGPRDLVNIALTPYFAGLDTVSGTLAFALYAVLSDSALHARLRSEVDDVLTRDGKIGAESLKTMPVLRAVVMETLRLYPTAVVSIRVTTCDMVVGGYHIPKGSELALPFNVPHWMREYFAHPTTFDVDRYTKARSEHKQSGAYAPFSVGNHVCLGAGLAEVLTALNLAQLMAQLELKLEPGYRLRKSYVPLAAPRGMRWVVSRRSRTLPGFAGACPGG
jgi:cytochrome P450